MALGLVATVVFGAVVACQAVAPTVIATADQTKKINLDLIIEYGTNKSSDKYTGIETEEGKTALEVTQKVAQTTTSGQGETAFVTGINGRVADAGKREFWQLLINGKPSEVGAGSYKVRDGDKIEWRISTY